MNHRAVRRANREVTNPAELRSIVERAQVLRVACMDEEGLFITPLSFGFDWEDGVDTPTFWVHCAAEGRKTDAWAKHPEVALELDVPAGVIEGDFSCSYSYAFESVMATGRMAHVTFDVQKCWGLRRIMEHMAPGASVEFAPAAVERVDVWRIDLNRITGKRREGMASPHAVPEHVTPAPAEAPVAAPALKPIGQAEVDRMLAGEKCPGCGMHCPLADPTCGRGMEAQYRRLAQDGYALKD